MQIAERIAAVTVRRSATIRDTMRAVDAGALGVALLVDDAGRFQGVVTDGDLRRALLAGLGLGSPVDAVARPHSVAVPVGTAAEVIADMVGDRIRCLPLLDPDGRVVDLALFDRRTHLPVAQPLLGDQELRYLTECLVTGWVSSAGKFVGRFEEVYLRHCGTRYAIACSSGTAALHLSLVALGVGPGDEVIVPSFTFIASANAVTYTGARPVFVDSEPETWNMDPAAVEGALTERTKAIMPVHVYGNPASMDPILEIARARRLAVIEDAAEAQGARFRGRVVGGLGDVGCFSFYGNKIITTGEGGMVVTDRADVAEAARQLRDHGMSPDRRYWHTMLGFNYRMTNLQAALGVAQMERLDAILARRKAIADLYTRLLGGVPGVVLRTDAPGTESVCWLYSILIDERAFGMSRDELVRSLNESGVDTRPLFPPIHTQPVYQTGQSLPVAERLGATGLSLPSAPGLSDRDVEHVADAISHAAVSQPVRHRG